MDRKFLEKNNYVTKAAAASNYWFQLSKRKIDKLISENDGEFNIIIFGDDTGLMDYYTIPFVEIQDLLSEDNLYYSGERIRWVGDIRNNILRIRNSKIFRNISEYYSLPMSTDTAIASIFTLTTQNDYSIENRRREIAVRIKQSKFRKDILENFEYKCCLTGATENHLLVASHIIPWASQIETRLSPHNGLCLSVLYDNLFDKGFFTFNDNYEVVLTTKLNQLSPQTQEWLNAIFGRVLTTPTKFEISKNALAHHREFIFDKF